MARVLNLSFYRFTRLRDLEGLRKRLKARAVESGLHGSILLSEEGINGFLAGGEGELRSYIAWLISEIPGLEGLRPKESFSVNIPFTRMLVKIKKEIITMGRPEVIPSEKTGKNLSASELKRWYDEKRDFVMVDTRNDYEIAQGAFKKSVHYGIETFREFPKHLEREAENLRDKTVVMYCTGGIRCEKATALAMDLGIKDVYQLEGGILKYFEEVGGDHYRGECFVFDHRSTVDAGLAALPDRKLKEKTEGLKLYTHSKCPYCIRVAMALEAKGLDFEKIEVDLGKLPPEIGKLNPHGEVPILLNGDFTLYQSNLILSYLDENFPETRDLTPASPERRARMRIWLDWVDRLFAPDTAKWMSDRSRFSHEENHALEVRLEKHLYRLKTPLQKNRRYLVIDDLTQADLAAHAMLANLRATGFPKDFPERFIPVWEWMDRVEKEVCSGQTPAPKVLRRTAAWPN